MEDCLELTGGGPWDVVSDIVVVLRSLEVDMNIADFLSLAVGYS